MIFETLKICKNETIIIVFIKSSADCQFSLIFSINNNFQRISVCIFVLNMFPHIFIDFARMSLFWPFLALGFSDWVSYMVMDLVSSCSIGICFICLLQIFNCFWIRLLFIKLCCILRFCCFQLIDGVIFIKEELKEK